MVTRAISDRRNILRKLAGSDLPMGQMVDELVWRTLGRAPSAVERQRMSDMLRSSQDRLGALEDIAWSLANAKEFVLRQ